MKEATYVKYLGIIIDQNLKWPHHITYLCKRLRKTIYKFVNLRCYLPIRVLRNVYLAIIQSIIQYGIIVWGGSTKINLSPLNLLQKRIIKICLKKRFDYPTKLIYSEFNVFNIEQIYKYTLLKFYHKNRNKFVLQTHNYDTRRNINSTLVEPKCLTSAGLKHSINFGPRLYNALTKLHPELLTCNPLTYNKKIRNVLISSI